MEPTIILILLVAIAYLGFALHLSAKKNAHLNLLLKRARKGYYHWIRSYAWKVVAELSKRRDKYTCRLCGRKRPHVKLHSHHPNNYDEVLFDEKPEDLTTLCEDCHRAITILLELQKRGVPLDDALLPEYRSLKPVASSRTF